MKVQKEEEETQKYTNPTPTPTPPSTTVHSSPPSPHSKPSSHHTSPSHIFSNHTSPNHVFSPPQEDDKPPPPHPQSPPPPLTKRGPTIQDGFVAGGGEEEEEVEAGGGGGGGGGIGSGRRRLRLDLSILKRAKRESILNRVLLGFRICGFVSCLISFSIMAADRDQGWALDSFYLYKEFRYCMAVNVIAFVYSGLQACDLIYQLTTRKFKNRLRYYLDFLMDQILTYLLLSASSSAAVRADDWELNWGKDKFPQMARASVGLSFLAFVAFALSSLVSGYTLCTL